MIRETYGEVLLLLLLGTNVVFGTAALTLWARLHRLEQQMAEHGSRRRHPGGSDL
jgi:hypothetical protein